MTPERRKQKTINQRNFLNKLGEREKQRQRMKGPAKERARKIRKLVVEHYGGRCANCEESRPEVLDIDHINNDGPNHKSSEYKGTLSAWILKNNFPTDFQLLCRNCNWIKYLQTLKN